MQNDFECKESVYESNMLEIAGNFFNPAAATEVSQCQEYQNQAIEINATDIDTNTTYNGSDFAVSDQACPAGQ